MAWLVTDLPEPDSPTMPIVFPRSTENDRPSTERTRPSSVGNATRRSRTSRKCFGGPEGAVAAESAMRVTVSP
jgi:hypothetical protein